MRRFAGADLFRQLAFKGNGVIPIVLGKLGNQTQLGAYVLIARFGVGNVAMRAVLDALLQIHEVSAAFVAESIEWATAKHTVEIVAAYFVAGEIFTRIVFEIGAVVFHGISLCIAFFLPSIILHFLCKKQELRRKFFGKYQIFFQSKHRKRPTQGFHKQSKAQERVPPLENLTKNHLRLC